MRTVDARAGIEWLDRDECLRLLAADEVGRLAVVAAAGRLEEVTSPREDLVPSGVTPTRLGPHRWRSNQSSVRCQASFALLAW